MKKVELVSVIKQTTGNTDLFTVTYRADGELYHKANVAFSCYGYTFEKGVGVDDFAWIINVVN